MIRNLLASVIILAASASAFSADIVTELQADGANSSDVIGSALSACDSAYCAAAIIADAIATCVDVASVTTIAIAANVPADVAITFINT
jgi:hypothetical protein